MFARTVRMQLKPNSVAEFTRTLENDIIPLLRKQPGFQDEIAFVVPGGTEAVSISVWDQQEDAEAYARGTYPQVLKAVAWATMPGAAKPGAGVAVECAIRILATSSS